MTEVCRAPADSRSQKKSNGAASFSDDSDLVPQHDQHARLNASLKAHLEQFMGLVPDALIEAQTPLSEALGRRAKAGSEDDKAPVSGYIVADKQFIVGQLVFSLERALSMAKQPSAKADEVIRYIHEELESIRNPNRALEQELARLVEEETPPNGEFYKTRADKSEFVVAFFHRVYGRFYDAGVLYRHHLRAMDFRLYGLLAQVRDQLVIPTKRDANDKKLLEIKSHQEAWRVARLISRRRKEAA